jgi:hypothetical protein
MMFAGTSGVDSQMDMIHPMVTDFGRSVRFFSRDRRIMTTIGCAHRNASQSQCNFADTFHVGRSFFFFESVPPICDFVES